MKNNNLLKLLYILGIIMFFIGAYFNIAISSHFLLFILVYMGIGIWIAIIKIKNHDKDNNL
jgi:hypothetical protein